MAWITTVGHLQDSDVVTTWRHRVMIICTGDTAGVSDPGVEWPQALRLHSVAEPTIIKDDVQFAVSVRSPDEPRVVRWAVTTEIYQSGDGD